MLPSKSPWRKILTTRSTSMAIERAAVVPMAVLRQSALPTEFSGLSANAKKNLIAVVRALGVKVVGIEGDGWDLWEENDDDRRMTARGLHKEESAQRRTHSVALDDNEANSVDSERAKKRKKWVDEGGGSRTSDPKLHPQSQIVDRRQRTEISERDKVVNYSGSWQPGAHAVGTEDAVKRPTSEDLGFAEALRNWAIHSPHTAPPEDAVGHVSRCGTISQLLNVIVAPDASPSLRASILSALTGKVGTSFAIHLVKIVVIPYAVALKLPAPRDVMQAIVGLSERHWRAIALLYEHFANNGQPVNGAIAEVLVRVAAVVDVEGAKSGLHSFCKAKWGEDGVRVVEALLTRCKAEAGTADALVPALERNVVGSEKSLRFGKLLFATVKDVPGVADEYDELMCSIASRSKVFLAKRALTLLKSKQG